MGETPDPDFSFDLFYNTIFKYELFHYFRYDYIDVEELLAAREDHRRKAQENQMRRRSMLSNLSKKWTRNGRPRSGTIHKPWGHILGPFLPPSTLCGPFYLLRPTVKFSIEAHLVFNF